MHVVIRGFIINMRIFKYKNSESGIVTLDQLCDLIKICNALKRFGSDDGFAGNQGDAFCNFILHNIEHDSGNEEDLSEDFISHYSQHE